MRRFALAAAAAVTALGALVAAGVAAGPVAADPLNPRDPDYCGKAPDIFFCTEHRSTYPNAGESAFLTDIRGRVGANEAQHLAAGRAVCLEFPSRPVGAIVGEVANHLKIPLDQAGQVVGSARNNICPPEE